MKFFNENDLALENIWTDYCILIINHPTFLTIQAYVSRCKVKVLSRATLIQCKCIATVQFLSQMALNAQGRVMGLGDICP